MQYSLSKIITTLILVLLIIGAVAWYMLRPQSSTQTNSQNLYSSANTNTQATVSVPSQTSQRQAPDIEKAYDTLFQKISAQKVTFTTVNSTSGAMGDVYALYASDIAGSKQLSPKATDFSIQVALTDLNGDGTQEALVYEDLPGYCGLAGCSLDIYQKKQSKWTKISGVFGGGDVGISSTLTNGYHDLFLMVAGNGSFQPDTIMRYVWDGTQYQQKGTVATWDGTTFNAAQ